MKLTIKFSLRVGFGLYIMGQNWVPGRLMKPDGFTKVQILEFGCCCTSQNDLYHLSLVKICHRISDHDYASTQHWYWPPLQHELHLSVALGLVFFSLGWLYLVRPSPNKNYKFYTYFVVNTNVKEIRQTLSLKFRTRDGLSSNITMSYGVHGACRECIHLTEGTGTLKLNQNI